MEETKIETKGIDGLLEWIDAKKVLVFVQEPFNCGPNPETARGIAYELNRKGCEAKAIIKLTDYHSINYDITYIAFFDDSGDTILQNAFEFMKNMMIKSVDAIVYVAGGTVEPGDIAANYREFVDGVGVEKVFLCLDTRETDSLISTLDAIEKESQRTGKDYTPKVLINTNRKDNQRLIFGEALLHH